MVFQSSRATRTAGHSEVASQNGKINTKDSFDSQSIKTTKNDKGIHVLYTNADSLRNKPEELKIRILEAKTKPHVICITEFKATNTGSNSTEMVEYYLNGYNLFHNNDKKNCHRGVLIYVDKSLTALPVD